MTEETYALEKESIFDKSFTCPCCGSIAKGKTVKTGKAKQASTDPDLRPRFENMDSLKYDGVLCNSCGYAALRKYFSEPVVAVQKKYIADKITAAFRPSQEEPEVYSYDEAIRRHKLAYISCVVKNGNASERGYTCLKTAWLYRGKREELEAAGNLAESEELLDWENKYLKSAYGDLKDAYISEEFPICGMDSATFCFLVAYLAYHEEDYPDSSRWIAKVVGDRTASDRVKERARDLKELVKNAMEELEAVEQE